MRGVSLNRRVGSQKNRRTYDPALSLKDLTDGFLLQVCDLVKTPLSEACWSAWKTGGPSALYALSAHPENYTDAESFADDHLVTSIYSKFRENEKTDRQSPALKKWVKAEESCRLVNAFLRMRAEEGFSCYPPRVERIFDLARRKIANILGEIDYEYIADHCRFGPGSDLSTRDDNVSAYNKFVSAGSSTPWIAPLFEEVFSENRVGDYLHECQFVRGNRLSFVPKNAVIDRIICVEPRWNIYLQLGIGELISQRLRRSGGPDIRSQLPNQEAAQRAYSDGLATIDLSSASDTIAKSLVLELLPEDWSDLIFKSRSPATLVKGKWVQNEKISSMGNGYTFPLETLIFYALSVACSQVVGSTYIPRVYGDDIIVEKKVFSTFVEAATYAGFSINLEKSFSHGDFFESCGADFFKGVNVRPVFVKHRISALEDYYTLANQIVEYAIRRGSGENHGRVTIANSRFRSLWEYVVRQIPESLRLFGPIGSSGTLHAPFDACTPLKSPGRETWEGWSFEAFVPKPVKGLGRNFRGHLFSKLSADIDTGDTFTRRGAGSWRRKIVYVPTYRDFCWS